MKKEQIIIAYELSTKSSIFNAYGKPSQAKVESFNKILKEMKDNNGYGMRILSHGQSIYTCAYKFKKDDKEYLKYHSKTKALEIAL